MTRRLKRGGRVLSVDAYIHRATLGLPKDERLDAAAELRTHLMDRVAELQAQGFARDEAEHLAVRGMGEVRATNRGLLGHAFTHRAGWAALALLLVGGGGWWTYREWLPPREGIRYELATPGDITRLFAEKDAPRGTYQAATLTFPRGTRSVIYANVASSDVKNGNDDVFIDIRNVAWLTSQNVQGRVPGSYRYQERWLFTSGRLNCRGRPRARLYALSSTVSSPFWNSGPTTVGLGQIVGQCNNPSVLLRRIDGDLPRIVPPDGEGNLRTSGTVAEPLPLNQWTVLSRLVVDPQADPNTVGLRSGGYSPTARGAFIAVLPLDRLPPQSSGGYSHGASIVRIGGDTADLPRLPPTVPR